MSHIYDQSDLPNAGYLIVKTFERMYREYSGPRDTGYSVPRQGVPAREIAKRYRGIARDPLQAWTQENLELGLPGIDRPTEPAACLQMTKLEEAGITVEDFILSLDGVKIVLDSLVHRNEWELIWACRPRYSGPRPAESHLLGFDPAGWCGDHFSTVMDSMCFPRWHGHDSAGVALTEFHDRLNQNALFDSEVHAQEFLAFYCAQEWAEKDPFGVIEVRSLSDGLGGN